MHLNTKGYNYPTDELFSMAWILHLDRLYILSILKLMFRFQKNELPKSLFDIFNVNKDIHGYNTRFNNLFHLPARIGTDTKIIS